MTRSQRRGGASTFLDDLKARASDTQQKWKLSSNLADFFKSLRSGPTPTPPDSTQTGGRRKRRRTKRRRSSKKSTKSRSRSHKKKSSRKH